jgi:hypothetical protein
MSWSRLLTCCMLRKGEAYKSKVFNLPDGRHIPYSERFGSHTLLAKDDPSKEPGYNEAMNLAKQVGKYVAKVMVRDLEPRKAAVARNDQNKVVVGIWLDWLKLLRYFCGHPEEAKEIGNKAGKPVYWWSDAINTGESPSTGHVLEYIDKAVVDERAMLKARQRLETEHNSMIVIEVTKYAAARYDHSQATRKNQQKIKRGETHTYFHDNADAGAVRVTCQAGEIGIELSFISMGSSTDGGPPIPLKGGRANAGEVWGGEFPHYTAGYQDSRYFQSNRTVITGLAGESTYDIEMISWSVI